MQGLNRIGNMLVPNSNYVKFEEWIMWVWGACHIDFIVHVIHILLQASFL